MVDIRSFDGGDLGVVIPGAFPTLFEQIPAIAGLVGVYFLGHGLDTAQINFAPVVGEAVVPTVYGTPDVREGYLRLGGGNYLGSNIAETSAMAMGFFGRRVGSAANVGFMGNYTGGSNVGFSMYSTAGASSLSGNAQKVSGTGTCNIATAMDAWFGASLAAPATGAGQSVTNHTAGTTGTNTNNVDRLPAGTGDIKLGRLSTSGYSAPCDLVFAWIATQFVEPSDRALMAELAADYAASLRLI